MSYPNQNDFKSDPNIENKLFLFIIEPGTNINMSELNFFFLLNKNIGVLKK